MANPRKKAVKPNIHSSLESFAVDIDTLVPLPGNPRLGDVVAIAKSYKKFGQRKPIVVRRSDNVVLAGNHQMEAAKRLGWAQIAVLWTDDDTITGTEYSLADNRTSDLGSYDTDLLADMLASVNFEDAGYSATETEEIMTRSSLPKPMEVPLDGADFTGEASGGSRVQWGFVQWESRRVRISGYEVAALDALHDAFCADQKTDLGFGFHLVNERVEVPEESVELSFGEQ